MRQTKFLIVSLLLAGLVFAACGPVTVDVPENVTINIPTALPGVTLVAATEAPPAATPLPAQATVIVPVTGNQPAQGTTTIIIWGLGGFLLLLLVVAVIALLMRPAVPAGPPPTIIEREREIHTEHRDDLP
jgi:hypothetical protein